MTTILIIDDDIEFCETMESLVRRMDHRCVTAHTLKEGTDYLEGHGVDVVFLDVRLPDGNGLTALPAIKKSSSEPEVIILTGQGDPDGAELAIQGGVWDYLVKPTSIKQTRLSLSRALKYREEKRAETPVALNLDNIIGSSPAMRKCFDLVAKAAVSNSQVLITGETGTGKELFARTIHENSPRAGNNFVIVDCASLTETLLESTLFGHKKGAFTGADADRTGLVKVADGGTLFLDEVGDMPLSIQRSFLRVLQEKRFRPVGQTQEVTSNFRLIAATNRNLEEMVETGEFRRDLLFRLWAIHLELPPLRKRKGDIKRLAMFFIDHLCEEYGVPNKGFDSDFFETLSAYSWPGNIRELFNVLEMAFITSGRTSTIYAMDLPSNIRIKVAKASLSRDSAGANQPQVEAGDTNPQVTRILAETAVEVKRHFTSNIPEIKEFKGIMEEQYLRELIRHTGGNAKKIMQISGLSKSHFYTLLKKKEISISSE
ncbi:Fis family transcriptional regulator [Desulfoluna limicola]|uniref:Fis family transcriptional regulator n=1 Tax=Desulfoluna limicola TaxID=2810562 RepID=A0ABM7PL47_9BACT|nr:sigma-54 dependent transcriptional regulator [Desulfoluna limicola]BCS98092.1 Fis family transcriptional regulator [Desulfoluna limicola]